MAESDALSVCNVSKTFGGQRALANVSLHIERGTVTALLGENGSGKSTLIKVIAGYHSPDPGGEISVRGSSLHLPAKPSKVYEAGIRFVHQDRALIEDLTICENFGLVEPLPVFQQLKRIDQHSERIRVGHSLKQFGISLDPSARIRELDPTSRTMVAIARAMRPGSQGFAKIPEVLILDEPTAALPLEEVDRVLTLVRGIADSGGGVLYVTHRIEEVIRIADRLVVLRDGLVVANRDLVGLTVEDVVEMIVGSRGALAGSANPPVAARGSGRPVLTVRGLRGSRVKGIDLRVDVGEIVGIAGLVGCGKSELARLLSGAQELKADFCVLAGHPYWPKAPRDAVDNRVGYVPEDRLRQGCIPEMSLQENVTLGTLGEFIEWKWLKLRHEAREVATLAEHLNIRPLAPTRRLVAFSGGNQQKAVIAKVLRRNPRVLILDEPFQGIDVGAKTEIRAIIQELASQGIGVLVASSDFEDFPGLCDRVVVLNRGVVIGEIRADDVTMENVSMMAMGSRQAEM